MKYKRWECGKDIMRHLDRAAWALSLGCYDSYVHSNIMIHISWEQTMEVPK